MMKLPQNEELCWGRARTGDGRAWAVAAAIPASAIILIGTGIVQSEVGWNCGSTIRLMGQRISRVSLKWAEESLHFGTFATEDRFRIWRDFAPTLAPVS